MAAAGTDADAGAIKVSASFYPLYDFTSKVGKGHVEVSNLVPAGTEPHDWEPSTQDMASLQEADLIVYNGAGMESWVDDVKASFGETGPVFVEASSGIELRAFSEAGDDAADSHDHDDHADEHDHGGHDPHVWLAPELAKVEAQNIKDALVDKDPDHAADYEDNYASFAAALDELDQAFAKLKDLPHKTIVVSHAAFGYLCDAYGLTQIPIAGMDAEGEPDAKTMAEIIGSVKELNVKTIFSEELVSPKVAEQIAEATGASVEVLNPLEGLTQAQLDAGEDYLSIMRDNLAKLTAALQS
jgi:zinc transport system substrate-binding protein